MYLSTETVNKLCIPFGFIIGPCTVISHITKFVHDIAKIGYISFMNRNYEPTENYYQFKFADLQWECQISHKYKPKALDSNGVITIPIGPFEDPEATNIFTNALGSDASVHWALAYKKLSEEDKLEIELENAKNDLYKQIAFIAQGIIRSIFIVGPVILCYYDISKIQYDVNKVQIEASINNVEAIVNDSIYPDDFNEVMNS
jgi:hypothetical protein